MAAIRVKYIVLELAYQVGFSGREQGAGLLFGSTGDIPEGNPRHFGQVFVISGQNAPEGTVRIFLAERSVALEQCNFDHGMGGYE